MISNSSSVQFQNDMLPVDLLNDDRVQQLLTEYENKQKDTIITDSFLKQCDNDFKSNISNKIIRNSIVSLGSKLSTIDCDIVGNITHMFDISLKKKDTKATNQGRSGRCWMFAGFNVFRHNLIKALRLDNFEFSETYLFFYDKLERSNVFLNWFIKNEQSVIKSNQREYEYMIHDFMGDGGLWNHFVNLINKYGVIPKHVMKETFQSVDTDDMNEVIDRQLKSAAYKIWKSKSKSEKVNIKLNTLKDIYNTLVKFLGTPPQEKPFDWTDVDEDGNVMRLEMTPFKFKHIVLQPEPSDFVVLCNIPTLKDRTLYSVKLTTNIEEGTGFTFLNVHMNDISRTCRKSIESGVPIWFACDVTQDFNHYHSILDDKVNDDTHVFEYKRDLNKKDKIRLGNLSTNHAMTIVGMNVSPKNDVYEWQIENSWGYWDNQIPGEDGFLTMSHSWFCKNVTEVSVHKSCLSRTVLKLVEKSKPINIDPWNPLVGNTMLNLNVSKSSHVKDMYSKMLRNIHRNKSNF